MRRLFRLMQLSSLIVILSIVVSCRRTDDNGNKGGEQTPDIEAKAEWYAAGMSYNAETDMIAATIWKEEEVLYTHSEPNSFSIALGVCVDGEDIFSCGYIESDRGDANVIWKNGEVLLSVSMDETVLSGNILDGFIDIAVVGGDVYALANLHKRSDTGIYDYQPVLYKNGTPSLLDTNNKDIEVLSIEASGSDLYAIGSIYLNDEFIPTIWKNGVATHLEKPEWSYGGTAYSLTVQGSDVYVVGEVYPWVLDVALPCVWKNGEAQTLNASTTVDTIATDMIIKYKQPQICGTASGVNDEFACVWENGKQKILGAGTATGIVNTKEGLVVVGCSYSDAEDLPMATVWKNGKEEHLGYGMIVRLCR
ncbi:MAG: hypothetical protein IJ942_07420 [Alistipes sp.]|nr:hypothetical protein [Alistipes sp.]